MATVLSSVVDLGSFGSVCKGQASLRRPSRNGSFCLRSFVCWSPLPFPLLGVKMMIIHERIFISYTIILMVKDGE